MSATLLFLASTAFATSPPVAAGVTASTGVGATFDGRPATVRLQLQGELPLHPSDAMGVGLVLPLEFTTSGYESFGVSTDNAMVTFVPSLRLRFQNATVARPYLDAGLGAAYITAQPDGWLFDGGRHRMGWTTRALIGLEFGPPTGGLTLVIEPLAIETLSFGDRHVAGYVGRLGVGVRY